MPKELRVGGHELVVRDGPGQQSLSRRTLQARGRREEERQHEDRPDVRLGLQGVHREQGCHDRLCDPGGDKELPPVHMVGERAPVEAAHQQRQQLDEADQPHRRVRAGQRVELVGDRDVGDHPAEVEDRPGDEQQPEVR
jgi:hypothetical protein